MPATGRCRGSSWSGRPAAATRLRNCRTGLRCSTCASSRPSPPTGRKRRACGKNQGSGVTRGYTNHGYSDCLSGRPRNAHGIHERSVSIAISIAELFLRSQQNAANSIDGTTFAPVRCALGEIYGSASVGCRVHFCLRTAPCVARGWRWEPSGHGEERCRGPSRHRSCRGQLHRDPGSPQPRRLWRVVRSQDRFFTSASGCATP
jgi:hypothetical protein